MSVPMRFGFAWVEKGRAPHSTEHLRFIKSCPKARLDLVGQDFELSFSSARDWTDAAGSPGLTAEKLFVLANVMATCKICQKPASPLPGLKAGASALEAGAFQVGKGGVWMW